MFRLCDDFDVCYYNQNFVVKSKNYAFSIMEVMGDELLISLLKSHGYKGVVLFDLLMSNGLDAHNRFIECYFNGESFNRRDLKKDIRVVSVKQVDIHNEYYRNKNTFDLKRDAGILTKEDVRKILKAKRREVSTEMPREKLDELVKTTRSVAQRSSKETDKKLLS